MQMARAATRQAEDDASATTKSHQACVVSGNQTMQFRKQCLIKASAPYFQSQQQRALCVLRFETWVNFVQQVFKEIGYFINYKLISTLYYIKGKRTAGSPRLVNVSTVGRGGSWQGCLHRQVTLPVNPVPF